MIKLKKKKIVQVKWGYLAIPVQLFIIMHIFVYKNIYTLKNNLFSSFNYGSYIYIGV